MQDSIIKTVAQLQDAINEYITPDWKEERTVLDFQIATNQEIAELIDSKYSDENGKHQLGWKWWKDTTRKKTTNEILWDKVHIKVFENVKIELVDILFFTLSCIPLVKEDLSTHTIELEDNDWENIMNITKLALNDRPSDSVSIVVNLAQKLDFNIVAYYCAKHQLNYYRQLDGYKDGTYTKEKSGVEDNELLHEIIKGISLEDFSTNFENTYNMISQKFYEIFKVDEKDKMYFKDWIAIIK